MKNTNFRDQCGLRKLENCHCQFYKEDFSQYVYMIYLVVASTTAVCPVSEVRSWYFFSFFCFFFIDEHFTHEATTLPPNQIVGQSRS